MSVSYDYYRIFYYVATYRSFNKAAAVLSNSQPNISRSIANLEAQLGCKLFNRSSTGVTLTQAGEELFVHVEAAYRHLSMGEKIIREKVESQSTVLSIGISVDLTRRTIQESMASVINALHRQRPDIRIEIRHASTALLLSDINNDLLDRAFISTSEPNDRDQVPYRKMILHTYKDIVIAGTDYLDLKDRQLSLADLNSYPLISLGSRSETYACYKELFAQHGLEYKPAVETASMGQVLIYAIENLGIGITHPRDAKQALEEKRLFEVDIKEKLPQRYIAMISNKREKEASSAFDQALKDQLGAQADLSG